MTSTAPLNPQVFPAVSITSASAHHFPHDIYAETTASSGHSDALDQMENFVASATAGHRPPLLESPIISMDSMLMNSYWPSDHPTIDQSFYEQKSSVS
jgi:hypothetical protein